MSTLISLNAGPKPPSNMARQLREIADAMDRNEITEFVAAYTNNGEYEMLYGASLTDGLVLASLLHSRCVARFTI